MSLLVRKINRAKWLQTDIAHGDDISADAITNCMKTTSNRLSVWEVESEARIEEAALAIASYNGIVNPNVIYAWHVLAIPNAYGWGHRPCYPYHPYPHYPRYCRYYHTVVCGENLYRISLRYGVNMWHIARRNGIYNLNHIWTGQSLCIP